MIEQHPPSVHSSVLVLLLATKQPWFSGSICRSQWPVTARGSSGRTPYLDLFLAVTVGFSGLWDIVFLSSFMLVSAHTPLWWWLFLEANECHRFFAYFKNGSSLIAEHGTINPWECSLKMHLPVPFPASLKAVRGLWPEWLLNRKILLRTEQFVLPRGRRNTLSREEKFLEDKCRQLQLMGCSWRRW